MSSIVTTLSNEYVAAYYSTFGVKSYHDRNIWGAGVKVYIIDTGLRFGSTPDLQNVIQRSFANAPGSSSTHGSFVAAIVAAPDNGFGIVGVAPGATVYAADVDDASGNMFVTSIVAAINDAVALNVDIITISLGTDSFSSSLQAAVTAAKERGILVFVAAGNSGYRAY